MKVFLYPLFILPLLGCKATLTVQSVDSIEKPTFYVNDTISLSLDYFQHHDFKEESPDEWTGRDDTTYLFKRFATDFDSTARIHFPSNQKTVSHERGCLPWGNLFSRMRPLDTLLLEMCLRQKALSAKTRTFVHFIFEKVSTSAGSSRYGPMSATQSAYYIFYVAGVAHNGAFYFRSFRSSGPIFNDTRFSVKREHKMISLIISELQKLNADGGAK